MLMRVKFYCPRCNEWTDEWVKVTTLPTPEQARKVHKNEIHQCWILVDYEATEEIRVGLIG